MKNIKKYLLDNGLTLLVKPSHDIPKVALQLWYGVGSKHEKSGERGLAHLLEHMLFKGTKKMSESDINLISSKLAGYTNAFTSYDYTGYLFTLPSQNWTIALDLLSDCMVNCTLQEEHLNSEFKAVIQELKMYKDDYELALMESLISTIFSDHPYHHPIIGYKQDLWNVHEQNLHAFYKKHYVPNNATLVIVGDVNPDDAYKETKKYFGSIPKSPTYHQQEYLLKKDIKAQSITLYRDVTQPLVMFAWVVPGSKEKKDYYLDIASLILACDRGSRLYKKLVDQLQLATHIESFHDNLTDASLFFIKIYLKNLSDYNSIKTLVAAEIESIIKNGVSDQELTRAMKKNQILYASIFDSIQEQAATIGQMFLATTDEQYIFNYLETDTKKIRSELHHLFSHYLRPNLMHTGQLVPIAQEDKKHWLTLQKKSDEQDSAILNARIRHSDVEPGNYVHNITVRDPAFFSFPQHKSVVLSNGMLLIHYATDKSEKIELILRLKVRFFYDPTELAGLGNFALKMLLEGTKNYTSQQLTDELDAYGMILTINYDNIALTMAKDDLAKGLELLTEILTNPTFSQDQIEKVRAQIVAEIQDYWDNPSSFASQLARQEIYQKRRYAQFPLGTEQSIARITRQHLLDYAAQYLSPVQAQLAIVGDFSQFDIHQLCEKTIGTWQGKPIDDLTFDPLLPAQHKIVTYHINRDQTIICFAGASIGRMDTDYDALLIFDQIFIGSSLLSMSSRLFQLRERTGMFYTIRGSLLYGAETIPGMVFIKTIVSQDVVDSAIEKIKQEIANATMLITQQELDDAKSSIISALVSSFESNAQMAENFLFLENFGLSKEYYDFRLQILNSITLDQIKDAVNKILRNDQLIIMQIGRKKEE